jgi:hypothetical protein
MTSQEKANELVKKYSCYFYGIDKTVNYDVVVHDDAKQCALIEAEGIRIEMVKLQNHEKAIYWLDVKREIKAIA